ncbi:hypothetical protein [Acinetobacter sp. YH12239]|uniref:hypothetical protein n=1 Tax=Acinetobacter sp. YH12239 TaxID=2601166 RepID=UPI0015D1AAE7|nr:hypothetical protein [Acinetobacter sp. YH12239]
MENNEHPRSELIRKIKMCEERRIDLGIIEEIFEQAGVEVAHRWSSLTSEAAVCSDTKAEKIEKVIGKLLTNHIYFDDKLIMVFDRLNEDEAQDFISAFSDIYSTDEALVDSEYVSHSCKNINANFTIFNFKIMREVLERKELTEEDLGELGETLSKYNRIVGYRPVEITCYDAVIIDTLNNRLILQLDLGSIVLANAVDNFFNKLRSNINKAFKNSGIFNCRIPEKAQFENLYTCIQNFYDNSEGEVTKASFSTSKNNHHETLRDRARDIRKAEYHLRGKAAEEAIGGKIRSYRISKRFERVTDQWPQVYVGIHYRYFNKSGAKNLYEAHIFDIKSYDDYQFTINKILANR